MENERKTPEERQKMTDAERIRHSCAHILATAIAQLWPDAQFAAGPPVENGFYYDLEMAHRISPEDFPRIEAEMKRVVKENQTFEKVVVARAQALEDAEKGRLAALGERATPSKFKLDIVQNIPENEPISYYKNGDFIDLCAGPHVMRTGNIGAFKLTHVASAYYKGDEKNPQLQRIYGTAFKNKTAMDEYFKMLEEAKRRDHRKIGAEMGLFALDTEYVGPGLPLWLPKGTAIVEELEKLAKETEFAAGYVRVKTPHIAKENMYLTSGHLPILYKESMFEPMGVDEWKEQREALQHQISQYQLQFKTYVAGLKDETDVFLATWDGRLALENKVVLEVMKLKAEDNHLPSELKTSFDDFRQMDAKLKALPQPEIYYLKAMNCPHHHRIFAAEPRSYRDLPLRLAEYGTCYRYEQSGELFGLMRVRSLNMNDAHIYCTEEQFADEFRAVNDLSLIH